MKGGKLQSHSVRMICSRKIPQSRLGKEPISLEEGSEGDATHLGVIRPIKTTRIRRHGANAACGVSSRAGRLVVCPWGDRGHPRMYLNLCGEAGRTPDAVVEYLEILPTTEAGRRGV